MKKITIFVLLMCLMSTMVCSCSTNDRIDDAFTNADDIATTVHDLIDIYSNENKTQPTYLSFTAYISSTKNNLGVSNKVEAVNHYRRIRASDFAAPESTERDFTFMQKMFVGSYTGIGIGGFDSPAYTYECSDKTQITVDSNGRIIQVSLPERFTYPVDYAKPNELLSPDTYVNYAFEYLQEILGENASRYEANNPDLTLTHIWVTFDAKDINFDGFCTFDDILIVLDLEGNLLEYQGDNVGLYKDKTVPDTITEDSIIEMIRRSLTESNAQIELSDQRNLVILSDGRMACYTNFRLVDDEKAGDWARVLIPLE